ncbi:hypothetical protein Bca4012_062405 [Brassica carinata]|uniref:10 kDa chaperonin n=1 Tax=Brassica carinata TaxID=52824 RepID=A0A8X7V8I9_BRACI|nr:hypothetical protein Bca52824_032302 [Brassica carinata]
MAKRLIPTLNRVLLVLERRDRAGNLIPVSVKEGDNVLLPELCGTQGKQLGEKGICSKPVRCYSSESLVY